MNELSKKPTIEITVEESDDDDQKVVAELKENNVTAVQPSTKMQLKEKSKKKRFEKRMRYQPKSVLETTRKRFMLAKKSNSPWDIPSNTPAKRRWLTAADDANFFEEFIDKEKGEAIDLPNRLIAMQYASGHAEELESMLNALKQHSGNKTPMQTLPFRLRRRAASYNSKRLPRRLRDLPAIQNEGKEPKVVTRRKRRRNINLQNEYARRAGKQGWLETHLWHSKRFRMSSNEGHFEKWDCKVALQSHDKTFRTSCRAVSKHCALQDLSFFKYVEVCASETVLMTLLTSLIMDFELTRLSQLTSGTNELEFLFYDKRTTPHQCVGPVSVLLTPVHPSDEDADAQRTMWLWLHPTLLQKIMNILDNFKKSNRIVTCDISKTLNRFRLTGPKSSVTLMSVLRSYKNMQENKDNEKSDIDSWLETHQDLVEEQHSIFVRTMKKCHDVHFSTDNSSLAPPCDHGQAYSLITNDPRLTLPLVKTRSLLSAVEPTKHNNVDGLSSDGSSPFWKLSSRSKVSSSRLPDHVVSTRKCEAKFLPENEKTEKMASLACPVPVVLVYQQGQKLENFSSSSPTKRTVHSGPRKHFGSGWDILLPSNWAMAFWIPLIYHQAKPVALKNYFHSRLERKVPSFPRDFPDTEAGAHWWKCEKKANHSNYYKKPPSKRPNYSVLGTRFPFAPDWEYLCSSESVSKEVLEIGPLIGSNVLVSEDLKPEIKTENKRKRVHDETDGDEPASKLLKVDDDCSQLPIVIRDARKQQKLLEMIQSRGNDCLKALESFACNHLNHLVSIELSPLSKGVPASQTMLCVPTSKDIEDLKNHFENLLNKGLADCGGPVEPKHWDPYRRERKEATKLAKKNRKRKKNKKIKLERNLPFTFGVTSSRKLIGFVTSGDFLFSFATGGAIGFITLQSVVTLYRMKMDSEWLQKFLSDVNHANGLLCLMKNIDTDQYRFAIVNLVLTENK